MKAFALAALLLISMPAEAVPSYAKTPAEEAMCQARVYSRLGPRDENNMHMHHYCDGLRFLDRAYATMRDKTTMRYNLQRSIGNLDYVLSHTSNDYTMRGEVHLTKARALRLMGKRAEAATELHRALEYPLHTPELYRLLSDHYRDVGDKAKALEFATEGLRRNPGNSSLQRRYTKLGGKLPYPEPPTPEPAAAEAKAEDPAVAESQAVDPVTTEAAPAASETPPAAAATAEPDPTQQIGSPTNPYCRFCP